ncbi:hypothetical protein ACVMB1_000335 [Bradyrhizobium sp. USDA 4504]
MFGQPLHAIGPVAAAVHQDLHGASDFGNRGPPGGLTGQHFQDGQLERHLPCLRWAVWCSSPTMDQGLGRIVNSMAPLTSTILANPARRRPEIARRLMRERSSRGQRCQRRRLVSSITDTFPSVSSFRIDSTSFASAGAVGCCETCAAYTSWPAGQECTVRTIHGTEDIVSGPLCTKASRIRNCLAPASSALIEPATGLAAKPQLEATVVKPTARRTRHEASPDRGKITGCRRQPGGARQSANPKILS